MVALSDGMHGLSLRDKGMAFYKDVFQNLKQNILIYVRPSKPTPVAHNALSSSSLPIKESESYTRLTCNPSTSRVQGVLAGFKNWIENITHEYFNNPPSEQTRREPSTDIISLECCP
jgi:hypothetical protein